MNPAAVALAVLLHASPDLNVTGLCGCTTQQPAPIVVVVRQKPTSAPAVPTAPSNFNYGDPLGRWPALVQIVGDVHVTK